MDVAVVEHNLGGKRLTYEKICQEFAGQDISEHTVQTLARWDRVTEKAAEVTATVEGKRRKAAKKARKTELLQRKQLRSGAYTYVTSEKLAAELEEDSGSETESDAELSRLDSGSETESDAELHRPQALSSRTRLPT